MPAIEEIEKSIIVQGSVGIIVQGSVGSMHCYKIDVFRKTMVNMILLILGSIKSIPVPITACEIHSELLSEVSKSMGHGVERSTALQHIQKVSNHRIAGMSEA